MIVVTHIAGNAATSIVSPKSTESLGKRIGTAPASDGDRQGEQRRDGDEMTARPPSTGEPPEQRVQDDSGERHD